MKVISKLALRKPKTGSTSQFFPKKSEGKWGEPFVSGGIGKERSCHHCVLECTRFSCSVIHWFRLWRWLSVSKTFPSLTITTSQDRRTRFHWYFAMESWLFQNCFKKSILVMRISVSKEKRSVDQVWRNGNWTEKVISKPFSCVGVFEVFVLQAFGFKVKYS